MKFSRFLIVLFLVIGIITTSIYYIGSKKEGLVMKAEIRINGSVDGDKTVAEIEGITAYIEPISKIGIPKSNRLDAPGVMAIVIHQDRMIGEWTSVPYNGTGIYNITIGLSPEPNPGDILNVNVRVIDKKGDNIAIQNKGIRYDK